MPETTELMKRPTKSDCIVKRRALEMFMPKVKAYLGQDWHDSEQEYIEEQMMDVLDGFRDGYQMARELENRHHWEPDRGLLDLMDEAEHFLYLAHKEILGQWIKCYGIAPARKVGDVVSTTNWHRKGQIGTIKTIYEDQAKYAVHFPDQPSTSAHIIEYEEVIDAPLVIA
ncbi:unnamed protein product [Sphagnum jensenii]